MPPMTGLEPRSHRREWKLGAPHVYWKKAALSEPGYDDSGWLPACVPGTVLASYIKAGAVPDPNFDDWQFQISDAYFTADFWYRNTFVIPEKQRGRRVFLNFDAINWKADIYFNGRFLPNEIEDRKNSVEGAFIRGRFDITELVRFGEENCLAVLIYKNDNPGEVTTQGLAQGPGPNGGTLGADNPTLHATVGWDWLPTIRGRGIGIYGNVYLTYSGSVSLLDPDGDRAGDKTGIVVIGSREFYALTRREGEKPEGDEIEMTGAGFPISG